jgi:hypothetical protein
MGLTAQQKSLKKWTKQKWRTLSGKNSMQGPLATGERYMPAEHAATTRAKRKGTKQGKQFVANTPKAKKKIKKARALA